MQDAGEAGLPGITVNLYEGTTITAGQTPSQSTLTDSDGLYSFSQLSPGDYQLEFVPLSGYQINPRRHSSQVRGFAPKQMHNDRQIGAFPTAREAFQAGGQPRVGPAAVQQQ
ncbi:MAG: hypothetical protein DWG76_06685, partial [Chloroflexi bacterium]|nr:hypothetical protein [Chloroflexota bacterium]